MKIRDSEINSEWHHVRFQDYDTACDGRGSSIGLSNGCYIATFIFRKYIFSPVSPVNNMIKSSFIFYSRRSCHYAVVPSIIVKWRDRTSLSTFTGDLSDNVIWKRLVDLIHKERFLQIPSNTIRQVDILIRKHYAPEFTSFYLRGDRCVTCSR